MGVPAEHEPIHYGVYQAADGEEMVQLLGEVFTQQDPPAVAVGLTRSEFETFVRLLCPKAAVESLTIVARRAGTRELVGVLFAEDCASTPPEGLDRLSPKFAPIFDILGQLDNEYRGGRAVHPGESLHVFLLGVAASGAGQGIAQNLVSACLEHGRRKGYKLAVTEATNRVSQHIFRKLGFVERARRSYGDHLFGGKAVFASISEHGGPILMDRAIAA